MNIATLLLIAVSAAAWPANVNKAFLTSCVGLHEEMLEPCKCILKQMHADIPYKEYTQLLQSGSPMEDKRIQSITTRCLRQGAPKK
jgi:hypothetical protein